MPDVISNTTWSLDLHQLGSLDFLPRLYQHAIRLGGEAPRAALRSHNEAAISKYLTLLGQLSVILRSNNSALDLPPLFPHRFSLTFTSPSSSFCPAASCRSFVVKPSI
jgi:hypothetical protein